MKLRWAAMVGSVYRILETGNLVSCYSPVPSTSSSGTDTNVSSESSRLPGNGYERPTAEPMNDIVARIKVPSHCGRHLSTRADSERYTASTWCSRGPENTGYCRRVRDQKKGGKFWRIFRSAKVCDFLE